MQVLLWGTAQCCAQYRDDGANEQTCDRAEDSRIRPRLRELQYAQLAPAILLHDPPYLAQSLVLFGDVADAKRHGGGVKIIGWEVDQISCISNVQGNYVLQTLFSDLISANGKHVLRWVNSQDLGCRRCRCSCRRRCRLPGSIGQQYRNVSCTGGQIQYLAFLGK